MLIDNTKLAVLNSAVDTLEITIMADKYSLGFSNLLDILYFHRSEALKIKSFHNKKIDDMMRVSVWDYKNSSFKVKAKGYDFYTYQFLNKDIYVKVAKSGQLHIKFSSEFLVSNGVVGCYEILKNFLFDFVDFDKVLLVINRIDINKDVQGLTLQSQDKNRLIGAISGYKNSEFTENGINTGFVVNKGGRCLLRVYDKTIEISDDFDNNEYLTSIWSSNGWNGSNSVVRFEVQFRSDYIKSFIPKAVKNHFDFLFGGDLLGGLWTEFFTNNNFYNDLNEADFFELQNFKDVLDNSSVSNFIRKHKKNNIDTLKLWEYLAKEKNSFELKRLIRYKKEKKENLGFEKVISSTLGHITNMYSNGFTLSDIDFIYSSVNDYVVSKFGYNLDCYGKMKTLKSFNEIYEFGDVSYPFRDICNNIYSDLIKDNRFVEHRTILDYKTTYQITKENLDYIRAKDGMSLVYGSVGFDVNAEPNNNSKFDTTSIFETQKDINRIINTYNYNYGYFPDDNNFFDDIDVDTC
jgi:hypothetical protein